jgi:hypothetical protein
MTSGVAPDSGSRLSRRAAEFASVLTTWMWQAAHATWIAAWPWAVRAAAG